MTRKYFRYQNPKQRTSIYHVLSGFQSLQEKFEERMKLESDLENKNCFEERFAYSDEAAEKNELKERIYDILEALERRKGYKYRIALEQHLLQERTIDDIAKMLNVSKQRVWQMQCIGLREMTNICKYINLNIT